MKRYFLVQYSRIVPQNSMRSIIAGVSGHLLNFKGGRKDMKIKKKVTLPMPVTGELITITIKGADWGIYPCVLGC